MEQSGDSPELPVNSEETKIGYKNPPQHTRFTSDNQPPKENKIKGMLKKKQSIDLAKAILALPFKGPVDGKIKPLLAEYFGIKKDKDITNEMMLFFRQIEKAIQKSDTTAFVAVMDRAHGKPSQQVQVTDPEGHPLPSHMPNIVVYAAGAPPLAGSEDEVEKTVS